MRTAIRALRPWIDELAVAPLYRSAAASPIPQPDFLNTAVAGRSRLAPEEVLALAKALERRAGRRAGPRWGPRPLDVDLLLYGSLVLDRPELTLPHPRLATRRFVLEPLARIAPELPVPPDEGTVGELLAHLDDGEQLLRLDWSERP